MAPIQDILFLMLLTGLSAMAVIVSAFYLSATVVRGFLFLTIPVLIGQASIAFLVKKLST